MGREFDRGVILGIALLAALVAADAAVSLWNTRHVHHNAGQVAHTHETIAAAASVRADLSDLEAAQRTFLLTGDEKTHESYVRAGGSARDDITRLKELTADNPEQQARLTAASAALNRAIRQLDATVQTRRRDGLEAAARVVAGGASRQLLDEAEQLLAEAEGVERSFLADRNRANDRAYTDAFVFGIAAAVFGLLAVAMFVWLYVRSTRARTAAAAAVGREREWLRTTLASIGDAVIATDAAGNVTFLNPVAEALTGWGQADAAGQPLVRVFRIVNESTRREVDNPALRALRDGVIVGLANHTVLIARDGTERPIDDSAAPIRDGTGSVGGAVLVFRDIGERRRAEEAQARLAAIVESSDDAIVGKTLDGTIRYWNAGAERVFGYSPAEAVGQPITVLIPPERLDEETSIIDRLKRGERIDHFETVRVRKDGRRVDVSLTVSPIRDAHGHVIGASKIARDVSERRRAEQALRAERERSEFVREATGVGFWYCDLPFDVLNWDERVKEHFWLPPEAPVTIETFYDRIHPDDRGPTRAAIERSVADRAGYDTLYRTVDPSTGSERWVRAIGRTFCNEAGEPRRFDGVTLDVTEQRRAEAALRASDARNRFLLDLDAATRPLADPAEIMAASARLLAEHLGADRCAYADVEGEAVYVITGDFARGVPSIVGRWEVAAFGAEHLRLMRANETYVVTDADSDPRIGADDLAAYRATNIRAVVCVPLHKADRFTAAMAVHQQMPRTWTSEEIDLVTTVAGRCWEALERARVARTLRVSEERFRTLFEAMDEGYCVVEPIFDDGGTATDYRYRLANPALEHHTGLRDVVGRTARELMPGHESHWIEAYGRVAATGEPVRRTERVADLKRWFDVSAFPVGGGQVGVLFSDVTARTAAEESLRASEQRLAEVFRHAPSFMGVLRGPDHAFELVNDQYLRLVGGRELVGKPVREALPEVVGQGYIDLLDRVYRTGEPYAAAAAEVRLETAGRGLETRHVDFVYQPLRDAGGAVTGIIVQGIDQTERKRAEQGVRERDERLQLFLGAAADYAVIISGPDDRVTEWLGGSERITGWRGDEAMGQPLSLIFTPEDRAAGVPEQETSKAAETGRADNTRWHQRKDGSQFFAEGVTVGIRDPGGELRGFGKVFRDRTDRKRAEDGVRFLADASASLAELVDYESTLRRIANIAVTGFADWCVVDVMEGGARRRLAVTHTEPDEVTAARAGDAPTDGVIPHVLRTGEPEVVADLAAVDPATAPQGAERIARLRALGVRSYLCVPLLSRGRVIGGLTFLSHSARRLFGPAELRVGQDLAGRVTSAIENAQLYRDLQDQDRRKDEFLATLAHELRNPLAPVRNGVQILKMGRSPERDERTLGMMDRQLTHMVHMVDDLLDVSRVSSGKVVLRKERVELKSVIEAAVETTRQVVEGGKHELTVALPDEPLALDADRTRLAQVFANLLNNSAKYTPEGGKIDVSAGRENGHAVVRVADTGVGIPAEMLPKVFDMFTQVGTSLDRAQGGLGIGLTLVKRLVELHGGRVTAESPGPGKGSAFTVRLPLDQTRQRAAQSGGPAGDGAAASLRVLVVDDNRDAAESLAMILEMKGHEVRTAHDGPEALRVLGTYLPRLILLDLGLPGMTGFEVARKIRESNALRGVTLAALTGWGQEEDRRRTREAGFDYHMVKPADPAELDRILRAVSG